MWMSSSKSKNKPLVLVNFKTYLEVSGDRAVILSKQIEKVKNKKYRLAIAPPTLYLKEITKITSKMPVFTQHLDPEGEGAHTGHIIPYEVKKIGVIGTILNHSEKKLPFDILKKTVEACKHHHLITVVCASTLAEVKNIAELHPDYIAYEPAELIGGNISVTDAKPEIISKAVALIKKTCPKTKVLCGAGVHSREDLLHALKLGTDGILIAHAVVKAKNPKLFLEKMLS